MFLAGHLPTQTFSLTEMQRMPQCFGEEWREMLGPVGYSLWKDDRGRLTVTYNSPNDPIGTGYSVRPIIRVPAVSRVQ